MTDKGREETRADKWGTGVERGVNRFFFPSLSLFFRRELLQHVVVLYVEVEKEIGECRREGRMAGALWTSWFTAGPVLSQMHRGKPRCSHLCSL